MQVLDIAVKDLKRVFRSAFSLVMMFAAPLLITGLLYFAFGGLVGGDDSFSLPVTRVQVVNLDRGIPQAGLDAGALLVELLQSPDLAEMLEVSVAEDELAARAAVDAQRAQVALIIPEGFSQSAMGGAQGGAVVLYHDPTLSVGPGIVHDLVQHFLDGFSGARIAAEVTMRQLGASGLASGPALAEQAATQYAAYLESAGHGDLLQVVSPAGEDEGGVGTAFIGPVMASMMIFATFFMGAHGASSILSEDEEGTLARLFTTPVPRAGVLLGKLLGILVTLVIQTAMLLAASSLLFGISWGRPLPVVAVTLGMLVAATGFGVMLMSFVKNSRETGPVLGGAMTITGMLGGLFTNGIPNPPPALDTAALSMPQGWALRAWRVALAGANLGAALPSVLVLLGLGLAFFAVGVALFRKRFA